MRHGMSNLSPIEYDVKEPPDAPPDEWLPLVNDESALYEPWLRRELKVQDTPRSGKAEEFFFPSIEFDRAREEFSMFYSSRLCTAFLSAETGLPVFASGDLWPDRKSQNASIEDAYEFLRTFGIVFGGRSQNQDWRPIRQTEWQDRTRQIALQQVLRDGVPVFGGRAVCTYDANSSLCIVSSSLYPVTLEDDIDPPHGDVSESAILTALKDQLNDPVQVEFLFGKEQLGESWLVPFIYPLRKYQQEPSSNDWLAKITNWQKGEHGWQLYLPKDHPLPAAQAAPTTNAYAPVYFVNFVAVDGTHWRAVLHAHNLQLLNIDLAQSHDSAQYDVYVTTAHAQNNTRTPRFLDFGVGTSFADAERLRVRGDRFFDPHAGQINGSDVNRQILTANVYHHAWGMQQEMGRLLQLANQEVPVNPTWINPLQNVPIWLNAGAGDSEYKWTTRDLHFYTGETNAPLIREPGFDGEVVAHEMCHAVLHYCFQELLEDEEPAVAKAVARALDESLAFYLPCYRTNDPTWGDYAYNTWQQVRQLSVPPKPFFQETWGDPVDSYYAYAMWWARIFWKLRQTTSIGGELNWVLLKALNSLATTQPPLDDGSTNSLTKLRGAFRVVAITIVEQAHETHRNAIRQLFADLELDVP